MAAGDLDTRVSLQAPTTIRNAKGEAVLSYAEVAEVWAGFEAYRATEIVNAFRDAGYRLVRMKMRWRSDLSHDWRVVAEGRTYEVVGHAGAHGRRAKREYLYLNLREIE